MVAPLTDVLLLIRWCPHLMGNFWWFHYSNALMGNLWWFHYSSELGEGLIGFVSSQNLREIHDLWWKLGRCVTPFGCSFGTYNLYDVLVVCHCGFWLETPFSQGYPRWEISTMLISFAGHPQVIAMLYDWNYNDKPSSNLVKWLPFFYLIFIEAQMNMDGSNQKPFDPWLGLEMSQK